MIKEAYPGLDYNHLAATAYDDGEIKFSVEGNYYIALQFDLFIDNLKIYFMTYRPAKEKFEGYRCIYDGPIPLENGQPDWDFIRKILVNWRSF